MNIEQKLKQTIQKLKENNIEQPNLKTKIIIANVLKMKKEQLLINNKQELKEQEIQEIDKKIEQLVNGKPLQYITEKQEFMGLEFYVNENVLIPQPDTEILVEKTIEVVNKTKKNKILDMCTGSGCIAISLAENIKNAQIKAVDISNKALDIANKNAINNSVENKIKFFYSDMFSNIEEKFDIIVSNPPYIETKTIKTLSQEVQNEPKLALDGGEDGLDFYKIIANEAYKHLEDNGILIVEIGYNQKEKVIKLFEKTKKYKNIECKKDYSNNDRIIICHSKN